MQLVIVISLLLGAILSDEQANTSQIDGQQLQHLHLINNQTGECVKIVRCNYKPFGMCSIALQINPSERKCKFIFGDDTDTILPTLSFTGELSELPDAINTFQKLRSMFVSHVQLEIVEKEKLAAFRGIVALRLNGNLITELASDTFEDLKDLSILDLSSNSLKEIHRDVFKELHNLTYIKLSSNQMEILPDGLFRNNRKLEYILLRENKINVLHRDVFQGLHNITTIILSRNQLGSLPDGLFRDNQKLEQIWLEGNKINVLHRDVFQGLHNITTIFLAGNQLGSLPDGLFRDNQKLEQIRLEGNKINVLHRDVFKELPNLTQMDLEGNQLEFLPEGLFRYNQKLMFIYLDDNKIRKIECNFDNLPNLEFLSLHNNICINENFKIGRIDEDDKDTISTSAMQTQILNKCRTEETRNLL